MMMWQSRWGLGLALLGFTSALGCTPDIVQEVECSDSCGADCSYDGEFDYQGYRASCEPDGEGPQFCGVSSAPDCVEPDFEIEETTVAQIHSALRAGRISCEWLIHEHQRRALWHDLWMGDGVAPLNAFVYLNDRALETARRLDDYQRCQGELAGPLHCAPLVVKTNYASREVPLTNGSLALLEAQPGFDAFSLQRLRGAGAVLVGSTTMDEFAAGAQGLSGRSGKTGNAYDRSLNSGGSTAGSAVAVATNMAIAGLGTDNCSSLTIPAAYNGLFTMRGSHQLVSTEGIFPSNRLDAIAGPMTRTVTDLAKVFDAISRFNPRYGPHCETAMPRADSYLEFLDAQGLQGKRIGVLRRLEEDEETARNPFSGATSAVDAHYEAFFEELEALGAEVIDDVAITGLPLDRRGSGSGYDTRAFLERMEAGATSFEDICESGLYSHYVFATKEQCYQRGEQTARQLANNVDRGMAHYEANRAYVEQVLDDRALDALLYPADRRGLPAAMYTGTNCILASITGLPTVVVPSGHINGLPVGMSFTGRMYDEQTLFEIAYAYEQAVAPRQPPPMARLEGEPPLDIETFNAVHYDLGLAAFEEVLADSNNYELTAQVFATIAETVLEAWDLEKLLR